MLGVGGGRHVWAAGARSLKGGPFFRVRFATVTGIDVCTVYPNIAKSTQHHKLFVKIRKYGFSCYVFLA